MAITLDSPYVNPGLPWLRGNLHTHTAASDGALPPQEVVAAYARLGYDFLMLSDHDHFTKPSGLDRHGMVLIPGNEITAYGPHLLHVNARRFIGPDEDRQANIDEILTDGGFAIVSHPNWLDDFNHCDQPLLEQWQDYTGIEVYNGLVRYVEGSPLATDRWDMLLTAGRRVWGYGVDDAHGECHYGVAWTMVRSEKRLPDVVRALREGNCYASTGAVINTIETEGATVRVDTANGQAFHVYTAAGRCTHRAEGAALEYTVPDDFPHGYIRVEVFGPGDTMAWTQPLFVTRT